ncbi:sensor histidine kinase [Embleya scabrispora]|uniref:sensor histidine kinase n=1 Tax=Embleya scabrispora TaxID=159449 RepID=UPI000370946E|nr:histidine kinase [Embleya scabrispora]MYS85844.1 sensor histidine kinase [Streptomyces sp. SID5474]
MSDPTSAWQRPLPFRLPGLAPPIRRDCAIGGVVLAGALVLLATHSYVIWSVWNPSVWLRLPPLLLLVVAECHRSTSPRFAVFLAIACESVDIALGPSIGGLVMWSDVLYAACVYGTSRLAFRLLYGNVAALVVGAGTVWAVTREFRVFVLSIFYIGLVGVSPVLTGFSVREHREKAEVERLRATQTARLAELDHQAAVVAERARMARELHDVIANHLSAVAVQSTAALSVKSLDEARLRETLEVIRESSLQGLTEMRRMIGLLRSENTPEEPVSVPRLAETDRLVEHVRRAGLIVDIEVTGVVRELPTPVDLAAYRVVQETLTNALKHATPQELRMVFAYRTDDVVITGVNGIDPEHVTRLPGARAGLVGMSERVSLLGGVFEAGPREGRWHVRAELPCGDDVVRGAENNASTGPKGGTG